MARILLRAHGPAESSRVRSTGLALALAPLLGACVSYEPVPLKVAEVLAELESRRYEPLAPEEHVSPDELATFAVLHNPSLRAVRTQVGVSEALLVEAGLMADPEFSWGGMDALASQIVERTTSPVDFLSGFGLSISIPRPGELDAREDAARWQLEAAHRTVTQAEWRLAREVHLACEDLLEAQRLLEQNESLAGVAETTREYFERARSAGAATAIQSNLATGDLLSIRAERVQLSASLRQATRNLNALLGLPPTATIPVSVADISESTETDSPEQLVENAISLRPDLATLHASYLAAEERVRLEVTRQYPALAIGTGIALVPGFFTRFNKPAIQTAVARRESLRAEFESRTHTVRGEIHEAHAQLLLARDWLRFLEAELLPNAEASLQLANSAFEAGEVTLLEILTLQRTLVDARTRTTSARAELRRHHWRLLAACGTLLAQPDQDSLEAKDTGAPVR